MNTVSMLTVSAQSIPAICLACMALYVGMYHLFFFLRRSQREADLSFAFTCFAMALYDIYCAGLYSAGSPMEGAVWQRGQLLALALVGAAYLGFVAQCTGRIGQTFRWLLTLLYGAAAAVFAMAPQPVLFELEGSHVARFAFLGLPFEYNETPFTPITLAFLAISVLISLHLLVVVAQYRRDQPRRGARLLVAAALIVLGILNDAFVGLRIYAAPYLLEYSFIGLIAVMASSLSRDLAEASRTQAMLQSLEQRFEAFFRNTAVGFGLTDTGGRLRMANPGLCRMFGRPTDALLDKDIFNCFHDEDRAALHIMAARVAQGSVQTCRTEKRYQWPDGAAYWGDISVALVKVGGRIEGLIWLIVGITERRRAVESLRVLNEQLEKNVKERTSRLIEANHRLEASLRQLREDEEAGRLIQLRLLPPPTIELSGMRFGHHLTPSLYMSGDFLDYFPIDGNRIGFYAADVSGHGVSSAFVTVLIKSFFDQQRERFLSTGKGTLLDPAAMLTRLNNDLLKDNLDKHATVFFGIIDPAARRLTFANGGHTPFPILLHDGATERIEARSAPLGLFDESVYTNRTYDLPSAFTLAILSDGALDLLPSHSLVDKQAALESLVRGTGGGIPAMRRRLGLDTIDKPPDDVTILTISSAGER